MRAILLAAGFGTRMGALGATVPKGLMDLGDGRTVAGALLGDLASSGLVSEALLVTNAHFEHAYREWLAEQDLPFPCELLSDGARVPAERLGANGDLEWVLQRRGREPAVVLASDNLYTFSVAGIVDALRSTGLSHVLVLEEHDRQALKSAGCVLLDDEGRVVHMVEKPAEPPSHLVTPPLYAYTREALELVPRYLAEGGNPDAPGHYCAWLSSQTVVMAWRPQGTRIDIGSLEKLLEARELLHG